MASQFYKTTKYEILSEGFVSERKPETPTSATLAPRCALTRSGGLACVFTVQPKFGLNDFRPLMARSSDGGITWSEAVPIWSDEFHRRYSAYVAIRNAPTGDLLLSGFRVPISTPGEPYWSDAVGGFKANELIWTRSPDEAGTWQPLRIVPPPVPGAVEPGPLCQTRKGNFVWAYTPYKTLDPNVAVQTNQAVCIRSEDGGKTWNHNALFRFSDPDAHGAEVWVVELSDGRLLGVTWHIRGGVGLPNCYALSSDDGAKWSEIFSTGIPGQSMGLAPLPGGRVLMVYSQRKYGEIGVRLAVAKPVGSDFGVIHDERVWAANDRCRRAPDSEEIVGWTGVEFGGTSATVLPDGGVLVVFWCLLPSGYSIRYVKLRLN